MKPLSIEEIKQLEEDDYLWIVDFENNNSEYYKIVCNGQIVLKLNIIGDRCSWDVYYKDYGKTWVAYKNKEQAECKGELVELPCIIHLNEFGWFVQSLKPNGIIDYKIYHSLEQAEEKLKELRGE